MARITRNPINAAILARVSTPGQEDNSSLDDQIKKCSAYCDERGYSIIAERREIMSASFVLARSVFHELLDMAADSLIDVIVVDVPDRLGRGDAIAKLENMAELNNAHIEYAQPGRDKSTVEGLVQHQAEQMVSGIERINIRRRTVNGKKAWASTGRVIAPPRRPYGYKIVNTYNERGKKTACVLEIVDNEAAVVRSIFEWCAQEGLTTYAIARRLTEKQIPRLSSIDKNYQHMAIDGAPWSRSTVIQIIRNPAYIGQWRYGRTSTKRLDTLEGVKRTVTRTGGGTNVPVPPIVDESLFDAAQEQLAENRRKFYRPAKIEYMLRGRIRCSLCGAMLIGESTRKPGKSLYRCYACGRSTSKHIDDPNRCHASRLNADTAERVVWNAIRDAMLEPDRLWVGVQQRRDEERQSRRIIEAALAAIEADNAKDKTKIDRLLDLYMSGDLDKATYIAKRRSLDDALDKRQQELAALSARLAEGSVLTDEQVSDLRAFQSEIAARMRDDVPATDKMRLIDLLRVECVYNSEMRELAITGLLGDILLSTSSAWRAAPPWLWPVQSRWPPTAPWPQSSDRNHPAQKPPAPVRGAPGADRNPAE